MDIERWWVYFEMIEVKSEAMEKYKRLYFINWASHRIFIITSQWHRNAFMFQGKSLCIVQGIDRRSVSIQTLDLTQAAFEEHYHPDRSTMETCHLENENIASHDTRHQQVTQCSRAEAELRALLQFLVISFNKE